MASTPHHYLPTREKRTANDEAPLNSLSSNRPELPTQQAVAKLPLPAIVHVGEWAAPVRVHNLTPTGGVLQGSLKLVARRSFRLTLELQLGTRLLYVPARPKRLEKDMLSVEFSELSDEQRLQLLECLKDWGSAA